MTAFEVSSVLRTNFGRECQRVALFSFPNGFITYDGELFSVLTVLALAAITRHHSRKAFAVSASQRTAVKGGSVRSHTDISDNVVTYKPKTHIHVLTV